MIGAARPRLQGLDALRGTAALAVVIFHLQPHDLQRVRPFATHAYLAVDLFFMISGFILAHAYGDRLARGQGVAGFLRARMVRLYPLYALGATLGFIALLVANPGEVQGIGPAGVLILSLLAAALLPWVFGGDARAIAFPLNPPSWSLSLELWGNLAYGLVAPRLCNRLLGMLIAAGAAGLIGVAARTGDLNLGGGQGDVWIGAVRFLFAFSAGVGLQRLWVSGRLPAVRPPDWLGPALLAVLLLAPAAGMPGRAVADLVAILAVFPIMVACSLAARESRLTGLLAIGARISYPLYATHAAVLALVAWAAPGLQLGAAAVMMLSLGLAIATAWVVQRWFDQPVRAWLATRSGSPIAAAARSAA